MEGDEPVTPAPTNVDNGHQDETGPNLNPNPPAIATAADLLQLEQRLLARLQQTPPANISNVPAGSPAILHNQQGTSTPLQAPPAGISTSEADSLSLPQPLRDLFHNTGVDCKTILDIAHNRFKALNLYRLLSTEREQSDSRGVTSLNLDSMRVEQQRQWKEHDYKNEASFWRAWELYKAAFVATAPVSLQSELAVSLSIYTANLWSLQHDYTWAGMRAYHFSFHRDLLESGADRYNPLTWRTLDGVRVTAKCVPVYLQRKKIHFKDPAVDSRTVKLEETYRSVCT
jgi:hypothetical protein